MFDIDTLIRPCVRSLAPYSSARDEFKEDSTDKIFLDANENPFETGLNRYPDPQQRNVKSVFADIKSVGIENIVLGNGSDEVLDLLFRGFCEPGQDNVLTLPPTYGMYNVLANLNNIEDRKVPLMRNFQPDVEAIFRQIDEKTKIIFLCSPNNPTGNCFSVQIVEKIVSSFKGLVVIDEAYIDFSKESGWLKNLKEYPNLVIIQTMSKAFGLAGIRLGICYGSAKLTAVLNKIKPPYNINELTQKKVLEKLQDNEQVNSQIQSILYEKQVLSSALKEIGFIDKVYPSDANFLLVKVDDANLRYTQLIDLGFITRNRSNQTGCENCLRISLGTEKENKELINALKAIEYGN